MWTSKPTKIGSSYATLGLKNSVIWTGRKAHGIAEGTIERWRLITRINVYTAIRVPRTFCWTSCWLYRIGDSANTTTVNIRGDGFLILFGLGDKVEVGFHNHIDKIDKSFSLMPGRCFMFSNTLKLKRATMPEGSSSKDDTGGCAARRS